MAISILDSDRIYRYELEVFINHMDFTVQGKNAKKSRTKVNINYTVVSVRNHLRLGLGPRA
jgi:hypothetical protein